MRAFVAVEVDDGGILQAIRDVQHRLNIGARPTAAQNMHFTLCFLGDVPQETLQRIGSALDTVAFAPFTVEILGVGAFPRPRAPRVIWAGTDRTGGRAMKDLAGGVADALEPLGFGRGRPFRPHLTISRIKNGAADVTAELDRFGGKRFGSMTVSEIKLKQSRLTPSGPVYSDLGAFRAG